ncbi:hypothetical protein [Polynucleobacter sp. MWH-Svant-W18]|uniref:hypothetical protein n=1 Tax=Polynucleobacter sp. MWH-Svant-W18 TaxID=1855909 RepID=UPI001BFE9998|nr:hypothetical protein [Polynucleobacter sp. MWH-Svant-W18]QWD78734.1 hypothetical protein C2757_04120 [Polynucleobacter sp. MWH-Svant-W18]
MIETRLSIISASLFSIAALFAAINPVHANDGLTPIRKVSDAWSFELTPYLWAPSINSTLNYKDKYLQTANLNTNNIIANLKSGAMIAGEIHYGNWGVMADVVSATLQKTSSTTVTPQAPYTYQLATKATLQQTILTGAATYNLLNNQDANVDGLLGVRWVGVTATLNVAVDGVSPPLNGESKTMSTADPIVGFKGRYRIANSSWYVPFYADIGSGGGTTNVTWQAMLGIGKTVDKGIDVSLIYRGLYYDMDSTKTNGQGLLQKTTFQGPQLSATFNF